MVIFQKIKVWCLKGYRFVRFGFSKTRHRTVNAIFMFPSKTNCDYCGDYAQGPCVIMEAGYEVYVSICESCVTRLLKVFHNDMFNFVQERTLEA